MACWLNPEQSALLALTLPLGVWPICIGWTRQVLTQLYKLDEWLMLPAPLLPLGVEKDRQTYILVRGSREKNKDQYNIYKKRSGAQCCQQVPDPLTSDKLGEVPAGPNNSNLPRVRLMHL